MDRTHRIYEEREYVRLRRQFGDIPQDIEEQGAEAETAYLMACAKRLSDDQLIISVTSYALG